MSQEKIYSEITEALGQVPSFFQEMPEETLESEWSLFKRAVLSDETSIPPKYKNLSELPPPPQNNAGIAQTFIPVLPACMVQLKMKLEKPFFLQNLVPDGVLILTDQIMIKISS